MSLSAQDVGVPHFLLHGPPGTNEIFEATKKFVILRSLGVSMYDCDSDTMYEDDVLTVRYVRLTKEETSDSESEPENSMETTDDETDYYAHEINRNGKRFIAVEKPLQKFQKKDSDNEPVKRISEAMAFICKLNSRPGSLCLEKCLDRGVTPGPLLGLLKDGEDVTMPDGRVVLSSDVRMADDPGAVLIGSFWRWMNLTDSGINKCFCFLLAVLECPTIEYLDSLVKSRSFENYQRSTTVDDDLAYCIVHFTPEDVMSDPRYSDWMNKFGPSTIHLVLNERNDCLGSEAVHRMQHKLHLIHPTIFPLLGEEASLKVNRQGYEIVEGKEDELVEKLMAEASQSVRRNWYLDE